MADPAGAARRRRSAIADEARGALIGADPADEAWAVGMENAYFTAFSPAEHRAHRDLSRRAGAVSGAAAQARILADRNVTEIVVSARDRRGLFADLALAISSMGGNVAQARIFTSTAGEALDVFFVQDGARAPFGGDNARALTRLVDAVEAAARGGAFSHEPRRQPVFARASPFTVAPSAAVDNAASNEATVIETSGRDRPGLLAALARALSEAGLSILSAHIDSHGERAVDTFYVVTEDGGKLTDPARGEAVRARLVAVLDAAETHQGGRGLSKARASSAR